MVIRGRDTSCFGGLHFLAQSSDLERAWTSEESPEAPRRSCERLISLACGNKEITPHPSLKSTILYLDIDASNGEVLVEITLSPQTCLRF